MVGGRALAGSVAAHAGIIAWVMHAIAPRPASTIVAPRVVVAEPIVVDRAEPIVVELIEPDLSNERSFNKSATAVIGGRQSASASAPESESASGTDSDSGTRSGSVTSLAMRGVDLHPTSESLARIAGAAELPSPAHQTGRLREIPGTGGTAQIDDATAMIDVERDGTAHVRDKPDIDIHVALPMPGEVVGGIRNMINEWTADPYAGERYGSTQDLAPHLKAEPGQCDRWGDSFCDDALAPAPKINKSTLGTGKGGDAVTVGILTGRLDITSWLGHRHGIDVYASRKLKLLDDTRDERAERGARYRAEQLDHSAVLMRENLDGLTAAIAHAGGIAKLDTRSLAELHAAVFELWDECSETDAGERARIQVIGWIAAHLAAGAPGAFAPAETAAFDAKRTSTPHFVPYVQ
jgi:hypothetical protein